MTTSTERKIDPHPDLNSCLKNSKINEFERLTHFVLIEKQTVHANTNNQLKMKIKYPRYKSKDKLSRFLPD
ncbi:hypothetical protein [Halioxenophilus aromaticivorans]|uniref:Uncharacterized protein n=1 Tax=Halioxenophilus aromaticivorans TaxID=1306992 RepID=A0AAV3U5W3_9ALTE